jgi:phytanoyl-CoA hydroxylase
MKTTLTPQQIASYRENGFVLHENFLSPDELNVWRDTIDQAVAARVPGRRLPQTEKEDLSLADEYYANVFIQSLNLWKSSDKVKDLILAPAIGKMCCELEGIDGIRVWHDQALIKRPWDNPTAWHLDNPYWSFFNRHSISIWIALDDVTLENGSLFFLPGTHKDLQGKQGGIGANMNVLFKANPQWANIKSVAVPMKAGSCSFHNGWTAHGATANMTPGWRRAMTCAFMPDGSTFNGQRNILPLELFESYKLGDKLDNDIQNPIIWKKP